MSETPARYIRIGDDLWNRSMQRANSEGTNVSEVIRLKLEEYIRADEDTSLVDEDTSLVDELTHIMDRLSAVRKRLQTAIGH